MPPADIVQRVVIDVLQRRRWERACTWGGPLCHRSVMPSIKTLFDGQAMGEIDAKIALTLKDEPFWIRINDGKLSTARGDIARPDVAIETDTATLVSLLQIDRTIDDAVAAGALTLTDDHAIAEKFLAATKR